MILLLDTIGVLAYLAAVTAIAAPKRTKRLFVGTARMTAWETCSFLLALASTLFIPWTGVPVLGFPASWLYVPLICVSVSLGGDSMASSFVFIIAVVSSTAALNFFSLSRGVPGELYEVELIAMVAALWRYFEPVIRISLLLIAAGCVWSFLCTVTNSRYGAMQSFSFAGALVAITRPHNIQPFLAGYPQARITLNFVLAIIFAVILHRVFMFAVNALWRERRGAIRTVLPLVPIIIGCAVLIANR